MLIRPCPQALWRPQHQEEWKKADAIFSREPQNLWQFVRPLPPSWIVSVGEVKFKISLTDFGHLGVFPEHADLWMKMRPWIRENMKVLNLFAYSGGVTMAAAQEKAFVCHLDASKGMVDWARENAAINQLSQAPIRWIVDDAIKFLKREVKRQSFYDAIILDPPTFGRGNKGEIFKIERDLMMLLELCRDVLSPHRKWIILSCHTSDLSPLVLRNILSQIFGSDGIEAGEMMLKSMQSFSIPSGSYAIKKYG
jgi:23S rRNA (cytosine1962-C5)-methyltransferase